MQPSRPRQPRPSFDYRRYWVHLVRRDVNCAGAMVDALLASIPPWRIYLQLFLPALNLSGIEFAAGRIKTRDEHFVTHHTLRFVRVARQRFVKRNPTGPAAVASAVGTDAHRIGLSMVCDFLQAANWRPHLLGLRQRGAIVEAIARNRPDALLLSIRFDHHMADAKRVIADARRAGFAGTIVVGGGAIMSDPAARVADLGANLTATHGLDLVRKLKPLFPDTDLSPFRSPPRN